MFSKLQILIIIFVLLISVVFIVSVHLKEPFKSKENELELELDNIIDSQSLYINKLVNDAGLTDFKLP